MIPKVIKNEKNLFLLYKNYNDTGYDIAKILEINVTRIQK